MGDEIQNYYCKTHTLIVKERLAYLIINARLLCNNDYPCFLWWDESIILLCEFWLKYPKNIFFLIINFKIFIFICFLMDFQWIVQLIPFEFHYCYHLVNLHFSLNFIKTTPLFLQSQKLLDHLHDCLIAVLKILIKLLVKRLRISFCYG